MNVKYPQRADKDLYINLKKVSILEEENSKTLTNHNNQWFYKTMSYAFILFINKIEEK